MSTTSGYHLTGERLLARLRELLSRYRNLLVLAEEEQGPATEVVDQANGQWDVRVLSLMSETDARAVEAVLAALRRLDAGRYGICVDCHARIDPERLAILPEAAQCLDCAELAEEEHPRVMATPFARARFAY